MADPKDYRDHRYRSVDGRLDLYARVYGQVEVGSSGPPPVLMMHGLTRNSADFEPLIAKLDPTHPLIVADQRGRGLSGYDPEPLNYRPDIYVEDMWRLLDRMEIGRVILVGTSMGGLMSMLMGAQAPDRIAGIVINDIGPHVSEEGLDRIRSYVGGGAKMDSWAEAAAKCRDINESAMDGFGDDDWLAFARRTCAETPDGQVAFAYDPAISEGMDKQNTTAVPADLWPVWDALAGIPTLVIRGAKSDILSAETLAEMGRRHPDQFWQAEVAGRGHAPILDEPEAVLAVSRFLDLVS